MGTFRFKSDLRNHQAIVQPRLYDCLMVTQVTLGAMKLAEGASASSRDPEHGVRWGFPETLQGARGD